ncbi:MAG: hypothetical protein ACXVCY_07970 [Pseudobdellovibrionaceae bacterium]
MNIVFTLWEDENRPIQLDAVFLERDKTLGKFKAPQGGGGGALREDIDLKK